MQNRCICCSIANFLSSGCVVNESMLTGAPMPIQKFVVDDSPAVLDANSAARHQVYAGTTVLQSSSFHQSGNALLFCPRKKSQRKFSELKRDAKLASKKSKTIKQSQNLIVKFSFKIKNYL